jgi:beta-lactamase superfamily II metal-dependent hydrolase
MMYLRIFNVDHGFAALATAAQGTSILFDCGHNQTTGFRPSRYLADTGHSSVPRLVVSHPDEDHLTDLPHMLSLGIRPVVLHRNQSLDATTIARIKLAEGPLRAGVSAYLDLVGQYTIPEAHLATVPVHPGMELHSFSNPYPVFSDTNNLSLVSFLEFGDIRAVIPGDLEAKGWRALLADSLFRYRLGRVNMFVASHHGRDSGYCREVFDVCHPEAIFISDGPMAFDSQAVPYSQHASGIPWSDGARRYVITTRNDGHIRIEQSPGTRPFVWTGTL